jgi:hypothetical protein
LAGRIRAYWQRRGFFPRVWVEEVNLRQFATSDYQVRSNIGTEVLVVKKDA